MAEKAGKGGGRVSPQEGVKFSVPKEAREKKETGSRLEAGRVEREGKRKWLVSSGYFRRAIEMKDALTIGKEKASVRVGRLKKKTHKDGP